MGASIAESRSVGEERAAELRAGMASTDADELDLDREDCRVLYVDDDPDARLTFRRVLRRRGLQIDLAASGREAMKMSAQTSYAVIASDLEMPNISGIQLIETLHRTTPLTSFILVTGVSHLDLPTDSESARSISRVIQKPWDVSDVENALLRAIRMHHTRAACNNPSDREGRAAAHVLLLEDNPGDARLVERMLSRSRAPTYSVTTVQRLEDGLEKLEHEAFHVILTDLSLPDARGMDGVTRLQQSCPWVPIIVLSGSGDEELAVQAVQAGAQDYLVKGAVDASALQRSVRYAVERKAAEQRLAYLAQYDQLTGLANRGTFQEHARRAVARARRDPGRRPAILVLDLDRFKTVNDTLGHDIGDQLLRIVGERLLSTIRDADLVARLGGDEFAVLVEDMSREAQPALPAQRILDALQAPACIGDNKLTARTSIGIATFPDNGGSVEELTINADVAMYRAKQMGRNTYQFFDREMHEQARVRLELERDLIGACDRGEFVLFFQPLQQCSGSRIVCLEALIRWQHPSRGLVAPDQFIPLLEDIGEIVHVGDWVLQQACAQLAIWQRDFCDDLRVSVNVSPRQFEDPHLVSRVTKALQSSGVTGPHLELEVTENIVMRDVDKATVALGLLEKLGVRIAIDDFGTGFTQFACLVRYPISTLKIDRSVTQTIGEDDGNTITKTLIEMGHNLGMEIVAEGVEEEAQRSFLQEHGCDTVQGYLTARPMTIANCTRWLAAALRDAA